MRSISSQVSKTRGRVSTLRLLIPHHLLSPVLVFISRTLFSGSNFWPVSSSADACRLTEVPSLMQPSCKVLSNEKSP